MMANEQRMLYGTTEQEILSAESYLEAVKDFVEEFDDPGDVPDTVEIYQFAPMQPFVDPPATRDWILEMVIERLDDEYGDPFEGGAWTPTPKVEFAAAALVQALKEDYHVWGHETTGKKMTAHNLRQRAMASRP